MAAKGSALAQFLRARRSLVRPADVGLPAGERRRVDGLRREEVAVLAGISTDYYLRLEQGRETNPSDQVLTSIARALRLDDDAVVYMRNLMRHRSAERTAPLQQVNPGIRDLLDGFDRAAAFVVDPGMTVVVANRVAEALSPHLRVGGNALRELFLDPRSPELYRDWKLLTAWAVRLLRATYGQRPDPALINLVDELIEHSPRFRQLWDRHDVKHEVAGGLGVNHPEVGALRLNYQQLVLPGTGHVLVTYWADAGSPSEAGMLRLGAR
ncbi:helix-turn-helix domain-containing protein [Mycobacterium marseillense]|uniref:Transcriptional regulator n=1 Tax=Mycobacterium marseillense TaxID=701042 RepID=A0ABN5ZX92_9MYCO|nr:helix-turn-helix transcriptional regulator [Mycobacterium marseillense]MCV7405127.1 helix-turn-helix domain-containing protein [Mycobacterium marseillense]ORA90428.1 transcriptional regulator [Mycobacterium marseillense]BBY13285.1 transcriptional regulator [Mycobacterium marseillense]